MVKEIRRILFTYEEVTVAIESYGKKIDLTLPAGKIAKVMYGSATETNSVHKKIDVQQEYNIEPKTRSVIVTYFDGTSLEHKYLNLAADLISAALVEYCIHHKISLPRSATKTLDISDFNVILDLSTTDSTPDSLEMSPLLLED